ncbi:hypothetical protein A1O3_10473 [Capronia epimyces CBS 606.96]|uniref:Enoyl reductase (ER) domain-containing protein n=1 Tax=Capronia epimyces CBS 606.96 TaxID=1182542 RepID=W9X9D6_9EURO|nr:uncharacterized protein A1O3_10473 [Capronia epimyces CBS 606.96]EXJ76828.1 hypothetical protein A1O3_10473 [Capronia epimyces CBS 606.96]
MSVESQQWILNGSQGLSCLESTTAKVPELGRYDVLVKFKAVSLNYRDIAMVLGKYPRPMRKGLVPGSDGAGEVVKAGPGVTEFRPGDRVATCFFQDYVAGKPTLQRLQTALGADKDGVFRQYGIFPVHGLVAIPPCLDWREASTLSCAALTAWGCLHGERPVAPGDTVLIQGTGGVSLFGLQFAVAAGARVIATTSSDTKVGLLKGLGAQHVVNYKTHSDWGARVRQLTPNQQGCDIILEVGGPRSVNQSLQAAKVGADIHMIGWLGGAGDDPGPTIWDVRQALCNIKSVVVGSRAQFEDMNKSIEAFKIKPAIDSSVFDLARLKEAYQYLIEAKHLGKVVVDVQ